MSHVLLHAFDNLFALSNPRFACLQDGIYVPHFTHDDDDRVSVIRAHCRIFGLIAIASSIPRPCKVARRQRSSYAEDEGCFVDARSLQWRVSVFSRPMFHLLVPPECCRSCIRAREKKTLYFSVSSILDTECSLQSILYYQLNLFGYICIRSSHVLRICNFLTTIPIVRAASLH